MKLYRWIMRGSYYERIWRAAVVWMPLAVIAAGVIRYLQ